MEHCVFIAAASGLIISPILVWFALVPYPRLFEAISTRAATQPKGSNLRQLVALVPLLLMVGGLLVYSSFLFLLKWYYRVPSMFKLDSMHKVCLIVYSMAIVLSSAASVWWVGGMNAFRPPGYDPKNPNPDPDEWRWKS
jgi:hypothetical protein